MNQSNKPVHDTGLIQYIQEMPTVSKIAGVVISAGFLYSVYHALKHPGQCPFNTECNTKVVAPTKIFLQGMNTRLKTKIIEKREISHNTTVFKLELPTPQSVLGLPMGQHIKIFEIDENGEEFSRSYTPITHVDTKGFFELLIKIYRPCEEFPQGGKLTSILDKKEVGDSLVISGPKGLHVYYGNGKIKTVAKEAQTYKKFTLIAGGSGIAPIYQIALHILESSTDSTEISIITTNRTEEDILMKAEIDAFSIKYGVSVTHNITRPTESWKGCAGHFTVGFIRDDLALGDSNSHAVIISGTESMKKTISKIFTDDLKFPESSIYLY